MTWQIHDRIGMVVTTATSLLEAIRLERVLEISTSQPHEIVPVEAE